MKSKKKIGVLNSSLVGGGKGAIAFLISSKVAIWKKKFGKHCSKQTTENHKTTNKEL